MTGCESNQTSADACPSGDPSKVRGIGFAAAAVLCGMQEVLNNYCFQCLSFLSHIFISFSMQAFGALTNAIVTLCERNPNMTYYELVSSVSGKFK